MAVTGTDLICLCLLEGGDGIRGLRLSAAGQAEALLAAGGGIDGLLLIVPEARAFIAARLLRGEMPMQALSDWGVMMRALLTLHRRNRGRVCLSTLADWRADPTGPLGRASVHFDRAAIPVDQVEGWPSLWPDAEPVMPMAAVIAALTPRGDAQTAWITGELTAALMAVDGAPTKETTVGLDALYARAVCPPDAIFVPGSDGVLAAAVLRDAIVRLQAQKDAAAAATADALADGAALAAKLQASETERATAADRLNGLTGDLAAAADTIARLRLEIEVERAANQLLQDQLTWVQGTAETYVADFHKAQDAVAHAESLRTEATQERDHLKSRCEDLSNRLNDLATHRDRAERGMAEAIRTQEARAAVLPAMEADLRHAHAANAALTDQTAVLAARIAVLTVTEAARDQLLREAAEQTARVEALEASTSWRMTAPLRAISRSVKPGS